MGSLFLFLYRRQTLILFWYLTALNTPFHLMFSCENISFVLRTHHCSFMMNSPLILFWYLSIVFDVMALLKVPDKYPILGLRSVVHAVSAYLCVYSDRRVFYFRIDVWHLCNFSFSRSTYI